MGKKVTRSKSRQSKVTGEERGRLEQRRMLERGIRAEQKIRALSKQLIREIATASAALRALGHVILERETPAAEPIERETLADA